jgi:DNA-binding response OmpR family regulator
MKILIVEDEQRLMESMVTYLKSENFIVEEASDYKTARQKIEMFTYDCILLDVSLPDGDGLSLLQELKANKKTDGVIVISAKNSIGDRIQGLNLGADDYLTKPFHLSELNARILAVIRRRHFQGQQVLVFNELTIDLIAKTVYVNEKAVELTRKEYDLLLYLAYNKNRVISKNAIAEHLSGDEAEIFTNYDFIYSHMKNLKKKLQQAGCKEYIRSVYGMGYKFDI